MNLKSLYLLVLLICCISCHSRDQEAGNTDMQFRVDSNNLAEVVRLPEYNLQYCPPAGWNSAEARTFQERLDKNYTGQIREVLEVYRDSSSTAFLVVSCLPDTIGAQAADVQHLDSLAQAAQIWKDIRKGHFEHQGLLFTQYLLQSPQWVSFRLFAGEDDPDVRFDYFVSRYIYQNEVRKIESSIGSIGSLSLFN